MFTSFKRIFRIGYRSFFRNIGLSIATILVMVIVVFLATMLFLFNSASQILIADVQEKVDISVYFNEDTLTEEIMEIKSNITNISEVKDVQYVSREQALEKFIERHRDDPILMESLTEVGRNPFLASLSIKAHQASQYEQVAKFLEGDSFSNIVKEVDYYQRKPVIERLFSITAGINRTGITIAIVLGLIAILVVFNTIRVTIYSTNEEISVMKLVGASNWFIRGPFLIQGVIAGILATLIVLLITFGISYSFDSKIKLIAPQISTFNLFISSFWTLLLIQLLTGIGLGLISSMIAVRKYLKI